MHDHFGVALGAKAMAQRGQLRNQLIEVVDLAVVDNDHRAVLVVERLLSGCEVDDRQAAMAESNPGSEMESAFVGTTVVLRFVHAPQHYGVDRPALTRVDDSYDSAHRIS